ncbi:MAG: 2-oxoacid:acceptor oxidoreductase subunit alpha [Candidatus Aenigmarchaeota archaeon]|nr:2-oxoacid:acceptor oxidoreductase subunit alpha [Candidatus Aenigmarchaeota archaeon]
MSKIVNKFSWKIGGEAGDGILNAGLQMFAKTCLRGGLEVFSTSEYPSLIRGGHNSLDVRVEDAEIFSHVKGINLLVAMNKDTIDKHKHKLSDHAGVIYDGDYTKLDPSEIENSTIRLYSVPLFKIANENGGKIMRNTVALGATMALLDFDMEIFNGVISDNFGKKKGAAIVEANIKAAKAGYDYIKNNFPDDFKFRLEKQARKNNMFMSGNEAITAGMVKAGCKFYAAYPMTPASSLLSNMAALERQFNLVVKHTEDEIAAINMAIGASYAGVRAATGTSGGGFALMAEGFGMAAQMEVPLVVIEAQRPGPGTGMATHSGQGDLRFMLHASTDEFPRVVIAPGDVEECFYRTIDAFNIAEKYQMPVIVLTDKFLGESFWTIKEFETKNIVIDRGLLLKEVPSDYKRYKITENGVSPRAVPGQKNGMHVASSYEHDEEGNEREEEEVRVMMHNKRFKKFDTFAKTLDDPVLEGNPDAEMTIISWGSTKGPIREAMKLLKEDGISTNFLQVVFISPLPSKRIAEIINDSKATVIIENNKTAQLAGVIKEQTGLDIDHKILKYDGRPFSPQDIYAGIKELLNTTELKEIVFSKHGIIEAW